jgi:hypothetical protein
VKKRPFLIERDLPEGAEEVAAAEKDDRGSAEATGELDRAPLERRLVASCEVPSKTSATRIVAHLLSARGEINAKRPRDGGGKHGTVGAAVNESQALERDPVGSL